MRRDAFLSILLIAALINSTSAEAWSNGGYSADPTHPDYGTHDWIAEHALDWLPAENKQYITDNLANYLYGTELPDLPASQGGIGDTTKHHIYYRSDGSLQDGAAATRAEEEYQTTLTYLNSGNTAEAAKHAGAMAHYISDMAVFSHVMGAPTEWGTEVHHSDYENHVNAITASYSATYIKPLQYDGALASLTASDAAKRLALDTTLDSGGAYTAKWMDLNYNWSNTDFTGRSWESVNLAVNAVADTLATLYDAYEPPKTKSTITLTPSKTNAKENEQITLSGTLSVDLTAPVTICRMVGVDWVTYATTTATHGAYSTQTSFTAGSYILRASWAGDATYEAATSPETTITIQPRTASIKVIVVDEKDTPLEGATLRMTAAPSGQTQLQTTTPSDGAATFSSVKSGIYTFNSSKTGYRPNTITIQAVEDQTSTTKIILTKINDVPAYPAEATLMGIAVVLIYLLIKDRNAAT